MNSEVAKIMIKTVATTVDLLIGLALVLNDRQNNTKMKIGYYSFVLINLIGIWL